MLSQRVHVDDAWPGIILLVGVGVGLVDVGLRQLSRLCDPSVHQIRHGATDLTSSAREGALREHAGVAHDGQAPVLVLKHWHEEELLREDVDVARPALHARVCAQRHLAVGLELAARIVLTEHRKPVRRERVHVAFDVAKVRVRKRASDEDPEAEVDGRAIQRRLR